MASQPARDVVNVFYFGCRNGGVRALPVLPRNATRVGRRSRNILGTRAPLTQPRISRQSITKTAGPRSRSGTTPSTIAPAQTVFSWSTCRTCRSARFACWQRSIFPKCGSGSPSRFGSTPNEYPSALPLRDRRDPPSLRRADTGDSRS